MPDSAMKRSICVCNFVILFESLYLTAANISQTGLYAAAEHDEVVKSELLIRSIFYIWQLIYAA